MKERRRRHSSFLKILVYFLKYFIMKRIFAIFAIAMMCCASVITTLARESSTIKAVLTVTDLKDTCGNVLVWIVPDNGESAGPDLGAIMKSGWGAIISCADAGPDKDGKLNVNGEINVPEEGRRTLFLMHDSNRNWRMDKTEEGYPAEGFAMTELRTDSMGNEEKEETERISIGMNYWQR